MNDEQLLQAFMEFLVQKSGAKNEKELQAYVQQLGKEGLQQAYAEFTELIQQKTQKAKRGAKLQYLKKLKHQCPEGYELTYLKKGGIVECGCGKKMENGGKAEKKQSVVDKFKARKHGDFIDSTGKKVVPKKLSKEELDKRIKESEEDYNKGMTPANAADKKLPKKANWGLKLKTNFAKKGSKVKMGCK